MLKQTERDWPEDFKDDDNGQYSHICTDCGGEFMAHKRRFATCKVCYIKNLHKRIDELETKLDNAGPKDFVHQDAVDQKAGMIAISNLAEIIFQSEGYEKIAKQVMKVRDESLLDKMEKHLISLNCKFNVTDKKFGDRSWDAHGREGLINKPTIREAISSYDPNETAVR